MIEVETYLIGYKAKAIINTEDNLIESIDLYKVEGDTWTHLLDVDPNELSEEDYQRILEAP